ncbi:glycosyltransferase-like protein gnt13 [Musca vetustissima]|uniref:glycosyltransferase-like protein gnt13 n=1 Tax=Musca vetustissima TaxID=27455 RepID=UPI002AB739C3|nr:glycosyltransferase-like protein gnt13 [Musca vetustissima]
MGDIQKLIGEQTRQLVDQVKHLNKKFESFTGETKYIDYEDEEVDDTIDDRSDSSLANALPELRNQSGYVSWRQAAHNGDSTIMEYYNKVNEKLTLLINKTIMTYGNDRTITKESNDFHRQTALKVFISGLNAPYNNIVASMQPTDLPNALAKAQEIESNYQRAQIAYNYDKHVRNNMLSNRHKHKNDNRMRYPIAQQHKPQLKPEPMDVDTSIQYRQNTNYNHNYNNDRQYRPPMFRNNYQPPNKFNNNNPNYNHHNYNNNNNAQAIKRPHNGSNQIVSPPKTHRANHLIDNKDDRRIEKVNNIEENHFLG